MRLERELKEAEEIARKEAEAEAAALTEILNLDSALQVWSHINVIGPDKINHVVAQNLKICVLII